MFKLLKMTAAFSAGLLVACGTAHAIPVPAGTLTLAPTHYNPTVNPGAGTAVLGVTTTSRVGVTYSGGTGQFANLEDPPLAAFTTRTISFSTIVGVVQDYSGGNAITNFLTFYDSPDGTTINETYSFNLDQSIQTISNQITNPGPTQGQTIGLYFLGDLTGTGNDGTFSATPTALTLTLNETGGSAWTFSATLSNPPPGSGVASVPVPEPASLTLMGAGLAALGTIRRRRKQ